MAELTELIAEEIERRLSVEEACETCGRGPMADTALAKLANDLSRLKLAQQKTDAPETQEAQVNPLALVATISKLPADNPTRLSMLERLEGLVISLQASVRSLREEEAEEEAKA